jgi:hypothetical protein
VTQFHVLRVACAAAAISTAAVADSISEKRIELLFRPQLATRSVLSPDGRLLAYTEHVGTELRIIVMDLDHPEKKTRIAVDEDRPILHSKEKQRAELRFLAWADHDRLVYAPTIETIAPAAAPPDQDLLDALADIQPADSRVTPLTIAPTQPKILAPIFSIQADGTHPQQLLDATDFTDIAAGAMADTSPPVRRMRPPMIKGFRAGGRTELLVEVPGLRGREPVDTQIFAVHLDGKDRTELHTEAPGGLIVYDHDGDPRVIRQSEIGDWNASYLYRPAKSSRWHPLAATQKNSSVPRFAVTPETFFGERSIPLGIDYDPNVLIYASNIGRDTFGIYGFNLATFQPTGLKLEHPQRDLATVIAGFPSAALVFDHDRSAFVGVKGRAPRPFSVWLDPELAIVQRELEEKFPDRTVQISQWDDHRTRFLVDVTGGTDPGRLYLYERRDDLVVELLRRAPWLPSSTLHETRYFEFDGPGGARLSGYLTIPKNPRLSPIPLAIEFAGGFPPLPHNEFDAESQVLADMGFIVCRLNHRGVFGMGSRSRDALRRDIDGAPAADAIAAIEWVASRQPIDRKRIITFGHGVAGYLAVRVAQLKPAAIRCAVTIEPVLNLGAFVQPPATFGISLSFDQEVSRAYLTGGGSDLAKLSITAHPDQLTTPVFIAHSLLTRGPAQAAVASSISLLRTQLKRREIACDVIEYNDDFTAGLPAARARVYRAMEEFLNLNLYNAKVRVGPTRVVK